MAIGVAITFDLRPLQGGGFCYFDPARSQILQHAHPVDLRPVHRNHRHRPKTPQPKPWRVTSLSGPTVTSLSGVYSVCFFAECVVMERPLMAQKADNWTRRLISRPRIPRRIFTAVPGPEKLEAQSKSRRDRQGRVAGSQMAEQEGPQARSTPCAHLARSGSVCRKKPTPRRPGFAPSP